ncbi:DUF2064 domain-containing protein [Nocardia huaxiensis]|uniref:DUF2064 domain-containing protein n=1 Tax=Nocardia huaxiensis TaxID=2755382 RepID=A0A7D6VFJ3_9NOCA|nr:DUF2064 domain-containing protein [Nocardia huaxiensis]
MTQHPGTDSAAAPHLAAAVTPLALQAPLAGPAHAPQQGVGARRTSPVNAHHSECLPAGAVDDARRSADPAVRSVVDVTLVVIAKAPIAGFAKTRLTPPFSPSEAAELAAAALLDTLDSVRAAPVRNRVVAWTGDLAHAAKSEEIATALRDFVVIPQRGDDFARRLVQAHADAGALGCPILQIGMDTPQLTAADLTAAASRLVRTGDTVLGPAADGGWWALGVTDPHAARVLADVPMSTPRTGVLTREALRASGYRVHNLSVHTDVDTYPDALEVAAKATGRFADLVRRHTAEGRHPNGSGPADRPRPALASYGARTPEPEPVSRA